MLPLTCSCPRLAPLQAQLLANSLRTLSLPLGRGALCLGSQQPLPTQPLSLPAICLSGLLPEQHYTTVQLDLGLVQATQGEAERGHWAPWGGRREDVCVGGRGGSYMQ